MVPKPYKDTGPLASPIVEAKKRNATVTNRINEPTNQEETPGIDRGGLPPQNILKKPGGFRGAEPPEVPPLKQTELWPNTLDEESTHTTNMEKKSHDEQAGESINGNAKLLDTNKPFQFDPVAVENLRQAIIQYDMMLLKNPELKQRVEAYLAEYKKNPH